MIQEAIHQGPHLARVLRVQLLGLRGATALIPLTERVVLQQPARQQVRAVHVANIWGTTAPTWTDMILVFRGRYRFIPSFLAFLSY